MVNSKLPILKRSWNLRQDNVIIKKTLAIISVALLSSACGSTQSKPHGFAALKGKRLSGTSSNWLPIASPFSHPNNISTTVVPPMQTNDTNHTVSFFELKSKNDATAFYLNPPLASRLIAYGILQYQSLPGSTGIPQPSRGLDLRTCLWAGGPNQGGSAGGTPSGGTMNPAGKCNIGVSSSMGVATIIQRGNIVIISESIAHSVTGGNANPSELSSNTQYAQSALNLIKKVGLK